MTLEFRREQTRFLNKMEMQKDRKVGGTLGIVESESQVGAQVPVCVLCVNTGRAVTATYLCG
jgi:hypothetical protein